MRSVTIRKLRSNLAKELEDLPVQVTKDGEVIATIVPSLASVHNVVQPKTYWQHSKDTPLPKWMQAQFHACNNVENTDCKVVVCGLYVNP